MLTDRSVLEQIRMLDREIGSRLRGTAAESLTWAEKLFDFLSEAEETHRQTLEDVERRIEQIGPSHAGLELSVYLLERQRRFGDTIRGAYLALQIQDVTMQAIERACGTIEKREACLGLASMDELNKLADSLAEIFEEYVVSDDLHRDSSAEAA